MDFTKAFPLSLRGVEEPVLTCYRLGLIVHRLYATKTFKGESLDRLERDYATLAEFNRAVTGLEEAGILENHPNFPHKVYRLLGRKTESVEEVACTVDPFCYVSHLSAMSHHGLTNRLPVKLFLSGPNHKRWREESRKQMAKDLGEELEIYERGKMPPLAQLKMSRIDRMEVHRFNSVHWGAFKNVRGKAMRVSTIGRTFLDMLRNPELCGGIHHVIEVIEEDAATYLQAIVGEIDQRGGPIDKVRAGYILDERMGIKNDTVDAWVEFAKRGGSRKLDASEEYRPNWSEKWCLSLNI